MDNYDNELERLQAGEFENTASKAPLKDIFYHTKTS